MSKSRRRFEYSSVNDLLGLRPAKGPFPTSLVERCEAAMSTPLKDLSAEQVRLLISQAMGLEYVLPLAFVILKDNPLIETDYYPGDLLKACLDVDHQFWAEHMNLRIGLTNILGDRDLEIAEFRSDLERFLAFSAAN